MFLQTIKKNHSAVIVPIVGTCAALGLFLYMFRNNHREAKDVRLSYSSATRERNISQSLPSIEITKKYIHQSDNPKNNIIIVYGSEGGTAESYAHVLKREFILRKQDGTLKQNVMPSNVHVVNPAMLFCGKEMNSELVDAEIVAHEQLRSSFISPSKGSVLPAPYLILFILATAGDGDPPKNFVPFFARLREVVSSKILSPFAEGSASSFPQIAVFALGDQSYRNFCGCGKETVSLLTELRRKYRPEICSEDSPMLLIPLACGDTSAHSTVSMDDAFDSWQEQLFAKLEEIVPSHALDGIISDGSLVEGRDITIMPHSSVHLYLSSHLLASETPFPLAASRMVPTSLRPAKCRVDFAYNLLDTTELSSHSQKLTSDCEETLQSPLLNVRIDLLADDSAAMMRGNEGYQAGDHLGIMPCNPRMTVLRTVKEVLKRQRELFRLYVSRTERDPCAEKCIHRMLSWFSQDSRLESASAKPKKLSSTLPIIFNPQIPIETAIHELIYGDAITGVPLVVELCTLANQKARATKANIFPARVSLIDVFTWYVDISGKPKKSTLRMMARCCVDIEEKEHFMNSIRDATDSSSAITVLDYLYRYPSCLIPLDLFLEVLPRITARLYSIASDPVVPQCKNSIDIVIKVVNTPCRGLTSHYMWEKYVSVEKEKNRENSVPAAPVDESFMYVYVKKSNFHLPQRSLKKRRMIMIGPGTGIAPLFGFLRRRQGYLYLEHEKLVSKKAHKDQHGQVSAVPSKNEGVYFGPCFLYFGCRNFDIDCILRPLLFEHGVNSSNFPSVGEELLRHQRTVSGAPESSGNSVLYLPIRVALSRPRALACSATVDANFWSFGSSMRDSVNYSGRKTYVQDLLLEERDMILREILHHKDGCIYICGDASHMARDVEKTLISILMEGSTDSETHPKMSRKSAEDHLFALAKKERYLKDVW